MPAARPVPVLDPRASQDKFRLTMHEPASDLSDVVEYHWIVEWDLDEPHLQYTLPHPNVHLTWHGRPAGIYGVLTKRFERLLEGRGLAHGVRFWPGAFHGFLRRPVAELTDRRAEIEEVFGERGRQLEEELADVADHAARVGATDALLRAAYPGPDPRAQQAARVVAMIASDRGITSVEELVVATGITRRTLQRLFRTYVGVGPKWVVRRYRLLGAVERATEDGEVDWAMAAAELGYADQAHLINDFRGTVGRPPAAYAADQR
jgi:AraC-like DNA-binding protein